LYNYRLDKESNKRPAFLNLAKKLKKTHPLEYKKLYSFLYTEYIKHSSWKKNAQAIINCTISIVMNLEKKNRSEDFYSIKENREKKQPYIQIPLKNSYYSDISYLEKFPIWNFIRNRYKLTRPKMLQIMKLLLSLNIVSIKKGYKNFEFIEMDDEGKSHYSESDSEMTKIYLNDKMLWKIEESFNKNDTMNLYRCFEIYSIFSSSLSTPSSKKQFILNKDHIVMADKKDDSILYKRASLNERIKMKSINSFIKKNNFSPIMYQNRIYGKNKFENGRFYDKFTLLKKNVRNKLIEYFNYKEIDFTASAINILSLYATGEKIKDDPYLVLLQNSEEYPYINKDEILSKYRNIFKTITNISISSNYKKGKSAIIYELSKIGMYRKDNEPIDKSNIKISFFSIINSLKKSFPLLWDKNLFFNNKSSLFMNIESRCAYMMKKEMIKKNIYPSSIHDAYVVPNSLYDYFNKIKDYYLHIQCKLILNKLNNIDAVISITHSLITTINKNTILYWEHIIKSIQEIKKIKWRDFKEILLEYPKYIELLEKNKILSYT